MQSPASLNNHPISGHLGKNNERVLLVPFYGSSDGSVALPQATGPGGSGSSEPNLKALLLTMT